MTINRIKLGKEISDKTKPFYNIVSDSYYYSKYQQENAKREIDKLESKCKHYFIAAYRDPESTVWKCQFCGKTEQN